MVPFSAVERRLAAWTEAAEMRRAQLHDAVFDAVTGAWRTATGSVPMSVLVLADQTRSHLEAIPGAIAGELRRLVNPLDLATREDVEVQTRLARTRVSFVLSEFLEQQRGHDQDLITSLRAELRDELRSLAAAIDDDLFARERTFASPDAARPGDRELDGSLDGVDDDFDLDGDGLDLSGYETVRRGTAVDADD